MMTVDDPVSAVNAADMLVTYRDGVSNVSHVHTVVRCSRPLCRRVCKVKSKVE